MKVKLSERALLLLRLIDENTEQDWSTGQLHRYWVPSDKAYYVTWYKGPICVGGGSDAAVLRSLARKGLIERPRGCTIPNPYAYAVTEDGHRVIQETYP
mgnify:CR=1 FL=1